MEWLLAGSAHHSVSIQVGRASASLFLLVARVGLQEAIHSYGWNDVSGASPASPLCQLRSHSQIPSDADQTYVILEAGLIGYFVDRLTAGIWTTRGCWAAHDWNLDQIYL